jgi:hypothetical protein
MSSTPDSNADNVITSPPASKPDWIARVLAALSFFVALLGLYCSSLQPASVSVGVSQDVLINKKPRIGILCSFTNEGARPAVVTSASLKWDHPDTTLPLQMTSTSASEFQFDEKGMMKDLPERFTTTFASIAIKGHDQSTSPTLWFTSTDSNFEFTSGTHTFSVSFFSGSNKIAEKKITIILKNSDIDNLYKSPQYSPTTAFRTKVESQE